MIFRPDSRALMFASLLASCAPAALAFGAISIAVSSAQALTQDVTLENIKIELPAKSDGSKGVVTIKKATFEGVNLSKEELSKLFSLANTPDEVRALAAKMTAAKISIPEIAIIAENIQDKDVTGATVTVKDISATKVDQGKAAKIGIGGVDVLVKKEAADVFKANVGAYTIEDADFSKILLALKAGDPSLAMFKYSKVNFTGADVSVVDTGTPAGAPGGNLVKFKMGPGSALASFDGDLFRKASGEVSSVSMEFPKASQAGQALAAFGYDKLDIGFKVAASYDPATKKFGVEDYTITGVNAGALSFKGQFGSVDPAAFTSADKDVKIKSMMGADFSALTLKFVNAGLAEKGLAFAATMQKKTPDALKAEISGAAKAMLPGVLGPDAGKKIADAVVAFLAAPKSLTFDVKAKGGPLKFSDLVAAKGPQDILPKVDINAVANQ